MVQDLHGSFANYSVLSLRYRDFCFALLKDFVPRSLELLGGNACNGALYKCQ
jgi:hypothetical protein